jgi:hypothetical protein
MKNCFMTALAVCRLFVCAQLSSAGRRIQAITDLPFDYLLVFANHPRFMLFCQGKAQGKTPAAQTR